jgi:hypothetical protein
VLKLEGAVMADIIDLVPVLRARRRREKLTDRVIERAVFRAESAQLDRHYRDFIKRDALDLKVAALARRHENERY